MGKAQRALGLSLSFSVPVLAGVGAMLVLVILTASGFAARSAFAGPRGPLPSSTYFAPPLVSAPEPNASPLTPEQLPLIEEKELARQAVGAPPPVSPTPTLWWAGAPIIVVGAAGLALCTVTAALWMLARWARPLAPRWRLVAAGLGLMVLGPTVLWGTRFLLILVFGYSPPPWLALPPLWPLPSPWVLALGWLPVGGLLLFAAGWALMGAGFSPGRSVREGALAGAGSYILVGMIWVVGFNVALSGVPGSAAIVTAPLLALVWPLQVAQVLELLGLSFG